MLYETPTFALHDYFSIIVFTCSILPQRFHNIRSLLIQEGNVGLPGHNSYNVFKSNNFKPIRGLNIHNTIFSSRKVSPKNLSSFRLMAEIVCRMAGLRKLRMDLELGRSFPSNESDTVEARGIVSEASPLIEMLRSKTLEGVEVIVTFDRLNIQKETARWAALPFIHSFWEL